MRGSIVRSISAVLFVSLASACLAGTAWAGRIESGLDRRLTSAGPDEKVTVIIRAAGTVSGAMLKRQVATQFATRAERHRATVNTLQATARVTQTGILRELKDPYYAGRVDNVKGFWIDNVITADMTPSAIAEIASRADVDVVYLYPRVDLVEPIGVPKITTPADATGTATPGMHAINADSLWALGYTGKGRLVASLDTGVDGRHMLLSNKWRGHNGYSVKESWWNPQSNDTVPRIFAGSGDSHGTWVMGIMVAVQDVPFSGFPNPDTLGVAFDAQWISAAAIDILGANLIEALQWVADPDGDPNTETDVPDAVNNSWGVALGYENAQSQFVYDTTGGCADLFYNAIDNIEAAGAVMIFAAGNEGDQTTATTIRNPGNRITSETNSFSVGMVDGRFPSFLIDPQSSRGPSVCDNATIKPEVVAPGVSIKTTHPNNFIAGNVRGTSFAVPHVAGGVALLREYNPNATPDEIKTAMLNSARDLGSSGPDNIYGHGMLDLAAALRLMPANDQPALYIKRDYYTRPAPGGSADMVIVLRSAGIGVNAVSVTVTSQDSRLTVTNGTESFGNFAATGDTAGNFDSPFAFDVDASVIEGERLPIRFDITGSGGYSKTVMGAIQVGPARTDELFTHDAGNFRMTVSALGTFGLHPDGLAPRFGGQGYVYGGSSTQSLFEGAFLVGIDEAHVSDNARDRLQTPDFDFQLDPGGLLEISEPGAKYDEETRAAFSDALAENPIGVLVVQRTLVSSDPAGDDYLIAEYTIHNRSGGTLSGLRAGLYFDWDFPWGNGSRDFGGFSASEGIGWMKESSAEIYRGLSVLTPPGVTSYHYMDNLAEIYDGFTDAEKWQALSEGLMQAIPDVAADASHLIATGPFTLGANDSVTVAFAIIGAVAEEDLIASAQHARSQYATNGVTALPTLLSFQATEGESAPDPQTVTVTNQTAVGISYDITHTPAWIEVVPTSGTVGSGQSAMLSVSARMDTAAGGADIDTLAPGTYQDSIVVTTDDTENPRLKVNASLTIEEALVEASIEPNPFSPSKDEMVTITFPIAGSADVTAAVYDLVGEKVTNLSEGHHYGKVVLTWDGKKGSDVVADGVYLCRAESSGPDGWGYTFIVVLKK